MHKQQKLNPFKNFIGIDQTGAIDPRTKKPKPLPYCKIISKNKCLKIKAGNLEAFTLNEIQKLLDSRIDSRTLIIADCVLWPIGGTGSKGLWNCFSNAYQHAIKNGKLGRNTAEHFFNTYSIPPHTRRLVEMTAKANSVLKSKPYQKNIQTGTFRIWNDLGFSLLENAKRPWANFWPFDILDPPIETDRPWIAEGYPSFVWKNHFKQKKRSPEKLVYLIEDLTQKELRISSDTKTLISQSADHADAAALAFFGFQTSSQYFLNLEQLNIEKKILKKEGWIFGVTR